MYGFLGEFLGIMVLIVFGVGSGVVMNLKGNYVCYQNWMFICLVWGLVVMFGVYVVG